MSTGHFDLVDPDLRCQLLNEYDTIEQAEYAALEIAATQAAEELITLQEKANRLARLLAEENPDCDEFKWAVREATGNCYPLHSLLTNGIYR